MANFPRVKPAGWALNEILTSAQQNALDIAHTKAANVDEGSGHTPAANIELTGPFGLKLMGTQRLLYASRTPKRSQPLVGNLGANYSYSVADLEIVQDIAGSEFVIPLTNLPNGAVLQKVWLRLIGAGGHGGPNMTATPPKLNVQRVAQDDAVPTDLGSTDDTTLIATYEAWHDLVVDTIAHTIDLTTYRYHIELEGEVGGDFQVGCRFNMLWTECDVTQQPEY